MKTGLPLVSPPENSKLGSLIYSWSIPAGRRKTCPGATTLCDSRCYAKHGHFYHKNVQNAHIRNLRATRRKDFVAWMTDYLRAFYVRVLRIHVAGDFYDPAYIRKWQQIVAASPKTLFFAYTRSWRVDEMLYDLVQLSRLSNFSLWWSVDRESGPAPAIRGIRRAYMATNDTDAFLAPDDCDLVFRVRATTPLKRANGVLVCPPENGVATRPKITCTRCGICWNKQQQKPSRLDAALFSDVAPAEIVFTGDNRYSARRGLCLS